MGMKPVDDIMKRMGISAQVAAYKRDHGLPIHVPGREQEILATVAAKAGPDLSDYATALYSTIFELSRKYQAEQNALQCNEVDG